MKHNTLSVIMTNYNHAKYISEALEAILSQSYRPLEIIVIDDASTDNSVEILEMFTKRDPTIHIIENKKNMGAVSNYQKLLELARGDYVYGAAADDMILPGFFQKSMDLLAQYPCAGLCSTLTLTINENGENRWLLHTPIISKKASLIPPDKALSILRREGSWIQGNTTIYRRDALIDSGGFIPELHAFCDGFIQQVIALKYGACFIPEPLTSWRRMGEGYAAFCSVNLDIVQNIVHNAVYLMKNRYSDLFPQEYIVQWQKEQMFTIKLNSFLSHYSRKTVNLQNSSPSPQTALDKTIISAMLYFKSKGLLRRIHSVVMKLLYRKWL